MRDLINPPASVGTVPLTNVACRARRSLAGRWNAIVDPYDLGYVDIFAQRNDRGGYFFDRRPQHPGDRVEYSFDDSPTLKVPGDWNTQREDLMFYEGTIWYRRRLRSDGEQPGRRTFLHVGAANHTARVFLDGDELAVHVGGYSPFAVELTGRLSPGVHSLVIQVNNRREFDRIPAMRSDWWNYGGLHRAVELVEVPAVFLRDAWVTMTPAGGLWVEALVDGELRQDHRPTVTLDFVDTSRSIPLRSVELGGVDPGAEVAEVGTTQRFRAELEPFEVADLARWNPGAPVLHRIRWRCRVVPSLEDRAFEDDVFEDDVFEDDVGLRTVRVEGNRILINDEPVFFRGISLHGEAPTEARRASGPADASTLLDWVEDLGANYVRLTHYQHDEHLVREADRRGLLAWCEIPVYWNIAWDDDRVLANALAQAEELVVRDRSRASVVLWSAANETMPGDGRLDFLAQIVGRIRSLDPTRLLTGALITVAEDGELDFAVDDGFGELLDVVAINEYLGWYYAAHDEIPRATFSNPWGKPMLFSEFGAGAKFGRRGDHNEVWTEDFQASVFRAQLEMVRQQPDCVGLSPWILKDFRAPGRTLPGIQDGFNRKGIVSELGQRKLAFEVLAEAYRSGFSSF